MEKTRWGRFRERIAAAMPGHQEHVGPGTLSDALIGWFLLRFLPSFFAVVIGTAAADDGTSWLGFAAPLGVLHLFPGLTAAALLRLGAWRLAQWVAFFDGLRWGRNREGGRLTTLALASVRNPLDLVLAATLDQQLARVGHVGAGTVLAAGIRAIGRGRTDEGRRLLRLVAEFDDVVRPAIARRIAIDVLCAEAVAAGEHARVDAELSRPRVPKTRFTDLLRILVRRARGYRVPDGVVRGSSWLAGRWPITRRLVARSAIAPGQPPPPTSPEPSVEDALAATVRLRPAPAQADLAELGRLWDLALEGSPPSPAFRAALVTLLAEALERAPRPVGALPAHAILREAAWEAAGRRQEALVWLAEALTHSTTTRPATPLLDEVDAFLAAVECYERQIHVGGDVRAVTCFPTLYYSGVNHTVWLHNHRKQPQLANALYRIELRFAEHARHEAGIALLRQNLACGPS